MTTFAAIFNIINRIEKMKKLLLLAFLAVGMTVNAEEKNEDVVLNDANTATFAVTDDDDDDDSVTDNGIKIGKGADENDTWSMHFNIGVNIPVSTHGLDFAPFRSWEFGWTACQYDWTPKKSKTTLSAGLGLSFRNYTLSGHDDMFGKVSDVVVVGKRDGSISELSSSIYTFGFSMPVLVKQRFGKNFAISVGAQLNWYCYGRVNNNYEIGDDRIDVSTKGIGYRPITVDILGIVHIAKSFGFYCKYSPMSVMKKDRGPEFKSISAGIYF